MSDDRIDLSARIGSILTSHPGPVRYFSVDSSIIKGGAEKVEEWCDALRKNNVEIVVMANCQWPSQPIEFPIQSLDCSSIRTLCLCFFSISDMYLVHVSNLAVIDLACCNITDENLFALVYQCVSLRELDIGLFSEGKVRIHSESLQTLQIWWSSLSHITVQHAPKLKNISVGPARKRPSSSRQRKALSSSSWITIRAPVLEQVWFYLPSQTIRINDVYMDLDNVPLASVRKVQLNIAYREKRERKTLMNFFKCCTELRELLLWRQDEVYSEEDPDIRSDDWSSMLKDIPCLTSHLQVLMMCAYGGGEAEIIIASAVLEHGACLENVTIVSNTSNPDHILQKAKEKLRKLRSYLQKLQ